jgi:hypothetical protein
MADQFSNIAFIVAAAIVYRTVKSVEGWAQPYLYFLTGMVGLIGLGSAIFHAVPSQTTVFFDAVPIYIFLIAAVAFALRCLTASWRLALGVCAAIGTHFLWHIFDAAAVYVVLGWLIRLSRYLTLSDSNIGP